MSDAPKTILVIQGSPEVRAQLSATLEGGGYAVVTAADGLEGLTRVDQSRPDLVLVDVMLPRLDGRTVARAILGREGTAAIPVVFLSENCDPHVIMDCLSLGARGYVTRPFLESELLFKVARALS